MGNLVVQQFVSADGFAANDQNEFDLFDTIEGDSSEFDRSNLKWLDGVGLIVLGAKTYRMFADYWPTSASDWELIAPKLNSMPKVVFSRTLSSAPWGDYPDVAIESGDATEAIRRLKNDTTDDLIVWGSLTLTETFFQAGAVDVVRLVVLPVAMGSGRGAFPPGLGKIPLRHLTSTTFESGLVELEYAVENVSPSRDVS